jgi:hypothetical protein
MEETMKTHALAWNFGFGLLTASIALGFRGDFAAAKDIRASKARMIRVGTYKLSGPYKYQNLTMFLIHGPDRFKGKQLLTLQEAMAKNLVVVHETKNVNQLTIENRSKRTEVFVQSGDIVKGGQQDRTIAHDLILPPNSGKMRVTAYCVEEGRWSKRGGESATRFGSSPDTLPSKGKKIAVRGGGGKGDPQQKVWMLVARMQRLLSKAVGKSVKSKQSGSSLALTLEDKKLLEAVDACRKKLSSLPTGTKDVIGYAFAINGEINSADIYGSHSLFKKLWPTLLKATAIEAIAEKQPGKKFEHVKAKAFKQFMLEVEKGKASTTDITKRVRTITRETENNLLYTTEDGEHKGVPIRKSYFKK